MMVKICINRNIPIYIEEDWEVMIKKMNEDYGGYQRVIRNIKITKTRYSIFKRKRSEKRIESFYYHTFTF